MLCVPIAPAVAQALAGRQSGRAAPLTKLGLGDWFSRER